MCFSGKSVRCDFDFGRRLFVLGVFVVVSWAVGVASIAMPRSNCYAIDNSSRIVDFTSWMGHLFEYEGKDSDLVVRFCKDVESRSQKAIAYTRGFTQRAAKAAAAGSPLLKTKKMSDETFQLVGQTNGSHKGYTDFGRFDGFNHFANASEHVNFVQEFNKGDLINCEQSYDKLGRTALVNIICGNCVGKECKGELGCICNVSYESPCRVLVDLAIPCEKQGPRVFKGFTVGFHPRSWEIVYNGMTKLGFEKANQAFSFSTEQTSVTLYMTAVASLASLVEKPTVKVFPEKGLEVRLSGSAAAGRSPTTLSPTVLTVDWTCEEARITPYEVEISIPVENYEPITFTLTKICDRRQEKRTEAEKGWAIFGILSCVIFVSLTLFCCGGFIYKSRVQNQHGLDALPGMTYFSAFLQTVSGGESSSGYQRVDESNNPITSQASWSSSQPASQGTGRRTDVKYGSI